ncbi:hypothetical protein ACU4GD_03925 [Cupriavidus basilensis]
MASSAASPATRVGGGRGNTVATIGGAVAGALAGNEVEKRTTAAPARVSHPGTHHATTAISALTQSTPYNLRNGDRVQVQNGVAMPY